MKNSDKLKSILMSINASKGTTKYTEDDVRAFCSTFCKKILNYNSDKQIITKKDALYKAVLEYFRNNRTDAGIKAIDLILDSYIYKDTSKTANSFCKMSNVQNISDTYTPSCSEIYKNAMLEHLKIMFSDIEFYKEWFYYIKDGVVTPRKQLINDLISFTDAFLELKLDLSFSTKDTFWCGNNYETDINHVTNVKTITDYKQCLQWLLTECGLVNNKNKIKLYGEKFGALLPKLMF